MPVKQRLRPAQLAILAALLVAALTVSLVAWRDAALRQQELQQAEFERHADQAFHALNSRLEVFQAVLRAGAGFWASHPLANIAEWRNLVQSSGIAGRYSGVDGIAYVLPVPPDGEEVFVADIRKRLWRDFTLHPDAAPGAAPDAERMAVVLIEPFARAARGLGYDIATSPQRRQAAELARDTSLTTLSSPLTLITGGERDRDFLLVQPIYRSDFPVTTKDQRRRAHQGWLLLGLHSSGLLGGLLPETGAPFLDLHVQAGTGDAAVTVYGDDTRTATPGLTTRRTLDFAGQRLVLTLYNRLPVRAFWLGATPMLVLAVSVALSLTLTAAAALLLISREQSRRLADQALFELTRAEKALAAVTASVPGVIYRWLESPTGGGFRFVAPQAAVMFATAPAALVEDWRRLPFLAEDLDRWADNLRQAAQAALPWEMEGRYTDSDGSVRWWKTTATPSSVPEGVAFDGIIVDITEQKEAEQVLAERERSYREMFERSSAVMILLDPLTLRLVDANPAAQDYYGYGRAAMRGMDARQISLLDEDGWRRLRDTTLNGEALYYRSRHRLASGEVREVEAHAGPVNVSGRVYMHVIVHDVTDRERFQAELQEKSAKLAASNSELEQFSYIASHDLQEPLRTIASFLQLLEKRYGGSLDGDAHEFIAFAVDAAGRLQTMIRDLLDYSRVGTRGGAFLSCDMGRVLEDVRGGLGRAIEETGADLTVAPLPEVVADRVQMQSLMQNLIGNALKYRRDGVAPRIAVSAEDLGESWRFRVADNGIGIDPEYFDRIFQVFQRLHTRDKFGGTGIGLALCKKIVERHGGEIRVESTPGEGTAFLFTLPKREPEE